MTRAIPVIVQRSPGGCNGYHIQVDGRAKFLLRTTEAVVLGFAAEKLRLLGAEAGEVSRVVALLRGELARLRRADVTAEVQVSERRAA